jgi:hypothetical protein
MKKIGFNYGRHSMLDVGAVCAALKGFHIQQHENDQPNKFSFLSNTHEYQFTTEYPTGCDKKIYLFNISNANFFLDGSWKNIEINSNGHVYKFKDFDQAILTITGENYTNFQYLNKDAVLEYLDNGNIVISSCWSPIKHENHIFSPFLNFFIFYHYYGFCYLNYYKFNIKNNLIGIYFDPMSGNDKYWRNELVEYCQKTLGNDFKLYINDDDDFRKVLQAYNGLGLWGQNHVTSYTDYTTSVCNIIFETFGPKEKVTVDVDDSSTESDWAGLYLTEKTLKALLFNKENIFFIWYGSELLFQFLTDNGFWFLNTPLYRGDIEQSVKETIFYIKTLKETLKDNQQIHLHLLEKYEVHLRNNEKILDNLLKNYLEKEKLIELINKIN